MQRNSNKNQQNNLINSDNNTENLIGRMVPRRGRPRKLGKLKISHPIIATGKGRGRPKVPNLGAELNNAAKSKVVKKTVKNHQLKSVISIERRGRPRKGKPFSDSENSYFDEKPEFEERRSVGRPSTGAVNLNIVRTGRGQGRPKKLESRTKVPVKAFQTNGSLVVRKRGRPSKGGVPYKPTGKPRGRPRMENKTMQKVIEGTSEDHQRRSGEVDTGDKHVET